MSSSAANCEPKVTQTTKAPSDAKPNGPLTTLQSCAVKTGGDEVFAGQKLGISDIETKLIPRRPKTPEQCLELFIDFSLAASNEDEGLWAVSYN
jgi:hypothetical protein